MAAVDQLSPLVGVKPACQALAVPRATWYRRRSRRLSPRPAAGPRFSPRAVTEAEQQAVLTCLHEDRFQDSSPAQVYAALLDEGQFHCSIRTMYRLLEARGESRERRDQLTHPPYQKPELLATQSQPAMELGHHQTTRPGEMDLLSPVCHLGCLQPFRRGLDDRLSRKRRTGQAFDRSFLSQATYRPRPADHPRRSRLLDEIPARGFAAGRPRRHQNTFPAPCFRRQSLFGTPVPHFEIPPWLPGPLRLHRRRPWVLPVLLPLVQLEHHHSGLGLMTPAVVHLGKATDLLTQRQAVLNTAFQAHPERFVRQPPKPPSLPTAVWINKPPD